MGTERQLPHVPDVLPAALRLMACPPRYLPPAVDGNLFPRAVHMRGWRHTWDLIVRNSLCSTLFFPWFAARLRALVAFLRDVGNLNEFARRLSLAGHRGAAAVIRNTSLVSLAEWRWSTLGDVMVSLRPILSTAAAHFDLAWFTGINQNDGPRLRTAAEAFASQLWRIQFDFVHDYMLRITTCMKWIGGCACHQPTDKTPCFWRGRRLHHAMAFIRS